MTGARVLLGFCAGLTAMAGSTARASHPILPAFERFHASGDDASLIDGGLLLLTELNCVACHQPSAAWAARLPARPALSLAAVGSRLSPTALAAFIGDPHGRKPGTLMPEILHGEKSPQEIRAGLVAYLSTLQKPAPAAPEGHFESGQALYHSVGCVACHAPDADYQAPAAAGLAPGKPQLASVPITLAGDYDRAALVSFLQNPLAVRPDGRMPASGLSDQEAADIAAFLQRGATPAPGAGNAAPAALIEAGRRQFVTQRCAACHETGDSRHGLRLMSKPLSALVSDAPGGCLSAEPAARVPNYDLSEAQRRALRLTLQFVQAHAEPALETPGLTVTHFMTRMNCYACHVRDGRGGLEPARAAYFDVSDPAARSLGELGNLPPALEHTGRKLTREWWARLLWGEGGGVRTYLTARMPKFGQANTEGVLDAWEQADRLNQPVPIDTSGRLAHQRSAAGRILMGTNDGGLGCISCHGLKDRKSLGVPVINLTHTVDRLRPAYFKELLLNPQAVQPGTLMPPLLMGRPKADQEVEQIWTYLKEIDQQRVPDGLLVSGEYELKPEQAGHPLILRTFLEGAGLEAVAVGFPVGRHVAFDAAEVRWALTWKGRFLDAMSTWEERAMTPAKPLGTEVQVLPTWMPFARLSSASEPWPTAYGPADGYEYRGMSLGADGTPTFLYAVGTLEIEDTIRPASNGAGLQRTLRIKGGRDGWFFRGLSPTAVAAPVQFDAAGHATIEETIP